MVSVDDGEDQRLVAQRHIRLLGVGAIQHQEPPDLEREVGDFLDPRPVSVDGRARRNLGQMSSTRRTSAVAARIVRVASASLMRSMP
jgi:hypothetical protein